MAKKFKFSIKSVPAQRLPGVIADKPKRRGGGGNPALTSVEEMEIEQSAPEPTPSPVPQEAPKRFSITKVEEPKNPIFSAKLYRQDAQVLSPQIVTDIQTSRQPSIFSSFGNFNSAKTLGEIEEEGQQAEVQRRFEAFGRLTPEEASARATRRERGFSSVFEGDREIISFDVNAFAPEIRAAGKQNRQQESFGLRFARGALVDFPQAFKKANVETGEAFLKGFGTQTIGKQRDEFKLESFDLTKGQTFAKEITRIKETPVSKSSQVAVVAADIGLAGYGIAKSVQAARAARAASPFGEKTYSQDFSKTYTDVSIRDFQTGGSTSSQKITGVTRGVPEARFDITQTTKLTKSGAFSVRGSGISQVPVYRQTGKGLLFEDSSIVTETFKFSGRIPKGDRQVTAVGDILDIKGSSLGFGKGSATNYRTLEGFNPLRGSTKVTSITLSDSSGKILAYQRGKDLRRLATGTFGEFPERTILSKNGYEIENFGGLGTKRNQIFVSKGTTGNLQNPFVADISIKGYRFRRAAGVDSADRGFSIISGGRGSRRISPSVSDVLQVPSVKSKSIIPDVFSTPRASKEIGAGILRGGGAEASLLGERGAYAGLGLFERTGFQGRRTKIFNPQLFNQNQPQRALVTPTFVTSQDTREFTGFGQAFNFGQNNIQQQGEIVLTAQSVSTTQIFNNPINNRTVFNTLGFGLGGGGGGGGYGFFGFPGGDLLNSNIARRSRGRRYTRTPSLIAIELGITSRRASGTDFTGLAIRPILTGSRRKRRKKR